jgi:hypothetical protein
MGRRVFLYGEEWDAAQQRPSPLPRATSASDLSLTFTRLSDGLEVSETVRAVSLDAAREGDLQAAIEHASERRSTAGPRRQRAGR